MRFIPSTVDEVSVRLVATQVLLGTTVALVALLLEAPLVAAAVYAGLLVDFSLRVALGPAASPLARTAMSLRGRLDLPARPTPFAPKRFAAAIGAVMTALLVSLSLLSPTWSGVTLALAGMMVLFPLLEAAFAFCVGCQLFALLMKVGLVPEAVCVECSDITARTQAALARAEAARTS